MKLIESDIDVISFDLGNTIIDLNGTQGFCTYFCQTTRMKVDDIRDILNKYFLKSNLGIDESVKAVCKILGIDDYMTIISEYKKYHTSSTIYPDVITTLENLRKTGYTIIACSNCVKWDAYDPENILQRYIDKIFYSFEIGHAKPEREFFEYVTNYLHVEAFKILHIGDSLRADYYAAREAGWKSILLDRNMEHSDLTVQRIQSLYDLY